MCLNCPAGQVANEPHSSCHTMATPAPLEPGPTDPPTLHPTPIPTPRPTPAPTYTPCYQLQIVDAYRGVKTENTKEKAFSHSCTGTFQLTNKHTEWVSERPVYTRIDTAVTQFLYYVAEVNTWAVGPHLGMSPHVYNSGVCLSIVSSAHTPDEAPLNRVWNFYAENKVAVGVRAICNEPDAPTGPPTPVAPLTLEPTPAAVYPETPAPTEAPTVAPLKVPLRKCSEIVIEGQNFNEPSGGCMGTYKLTTKTRDSRPVYEGERLQGKCGTGRVFLYFCKNLDVWVVGELTNMPPFYLAAKTTVMIPENIMSQWSVFDVLPAPKVHARGQGNNCSSAGARTQANPANPHGPVGTNSQPSARGQQASASKQQASASKQQTSASKQQTSASKRQPASNNNGAPPPSALAGGAPVGSQMLILLISGALCVVAFGLYFASIRNNKSAQSRRGYDVVDDNTPLDDDGDGGASGAPRRAPSTSATHPADTYQSTVVSAGLDYGDDESRWDAGLDTDALDDDDGPPMV